MPSEGTISFDPIGRVRNPYPQGHKPPTWQGTLSQIEIAPRWQEGLEGLDGFSHIWVLCYLHLSQGQDPVIKIRAQRNPAMPLVGFFSTRTPLRPNPISLNVLDAYFPLHY